MSRARQVRAAGRRRRPCAAAHSACTYGVRPREIRVGQPQGAARQAATSWSSRKRPAVFGTVATTRTAMLPRSGTDASSNGVATIGSPAVAQASANAASRLPRRDHAARHRCRAMVRGAVDRITRPRLPYTQAGDERDRSVDGDHLSMVAADPPKRAVEPRRVVTPDVDATRPQPVPERARRLPEPAHPVV